MFYDFTLFSFFDHLEVTLGKEYCETEIQNLLQWQKDVEADPAKRLEGEPHFLIRAIKEVRRLKQEYILSGRVPAFPEWLFEVGSHIMPLYYFKDQWASSPKLSQRVSKFLRNPQQAISFLNELFIGAHFHFAGFKVESRTVAGSDPPDLAVINTDEVIESLIECKTFEKGSGSRIHDEDFRKLVIPLYRVISNTDRHYIIIVTCARRLRPEDTEIIAAEVIKKMLTESIAFHLQVERGAEYDVFVEPTNSQDLGPRGIELINSISSKYGTRPHLAMLGSREPKFMVACLSKMPNRIREKIVTVVNEIANSATDEFPFIASIHIPEALGSKEIQLLNDSDFNASLGYYMKEPAIQRISAIILSFKDKQPFSGNTYSSRYRSIIYKNDRATKQIPESIMATIREQS